MSIRKRAWTNKRLGEIQEEWVVDYVDQNGKRRLKTYKSKKDAGAITFFATPRSSHSRQAQDHAPLASSRRSRGMTIVPAVRPRSDNT